MVLWISRLSNDFLQRSLPFGLAASTSFLRGNSDLVRTLFLTAMPRVNAVVSSSGVTGLMHSILGALLATF